MYRDNIVMTVELNGQVVQDHNGQVTLAPGVEYALRFKNKHRDKAVVAKFKIDGENASGTGYVIPAKQEVVIERFFDKPVKFRTATEDSDAAYLDGKNGPSRQHGLIEAEFYLEKEFVVREPEIWASPQPCPYPRPRPFPYFPYVGPYDNIRYGTIGVSEALGSDNQKRRVNLTSLGVAPTSGGVGVARGFCAGLGDDCVNLEATSVDYVNASLVSRAATESLVTVEGSESNQRFRTRHVDIESRPFARMTLKIVARRLDDMYCGVHPVKRPKIHTGLTITEPQLPDPIGSSFPYVDESTKKVLDENAAMEREIAELKNRMLKKELEKLRQQADADSLPLD